MRCRARCASCCSMPAATTRFPTSTRPPAEGSRWSMPRAGRLAPSSRSRLRPALRPKTALAPTAPTRPRCSRPRARPAFRSNRRSSRCVLQSTRQPTDVSIGAHASAPAAPKMDGARRSVDDWRRLLQAKPVEVAHDMIVEDGTLEAYQAFVALYAQSRFASEAHQWILRTQRMLAWDEAVTFNTAASYRAFLAEYPDSDLAATARKLIERLRYKPSVMPAVVAAAQPGNVALGNCSAPTPPSLPKKVELAPTNPAPTQSTTPAIVKKVEITPPPRDPEPPVRTVVLPPRPVQPPAVVYQRPRVF